MHNAIAFRSGNDLLILTGLALWLGGVLCVGCTDLPRPTETHDAMPPPITDTAAVYQVHGIRFAVPDGLEPITDRYVFTDLPIGGNRDRDPYNEITFFLDPTRAPEEIISDVTEGLDNSYDGLHLYNHRRKRIRDRMFTTVSIRYVSQEQLDSSQPEDTTRVDYAFTRDERSGETWGFRLIPTDTSLTPSLSGIWSRLIKSIEPQTTSSVPFVGNRMEDGTRYFHTHRYKVSIPSTWRVVNRFTFIPAEANRTEQLDSIRELRRAYISVSSETLPTDPEERTIKDLQQSFSNFGLSGTVQERQLLGRSVEWVEIEPRNDQSRVRTAAQSASIELVETTDYSERVSLEMDISYIVSDPSATLDPPTLLSDMRLMHRQMYDSIQVESIRRSK